jgi:hypothetical protein
MAEITPAVMRAAALAVVTADYDAKAAAAAAALAAKIAELEALCAKRESAFRLAMEQWLAHNAPATLYDNLKLTEFRWVTSRFGKHFVLPEAVSEWPADCLANFKVSEAQMTLIDGTGCFIGTVWSIGSGKANAALRLPDGGCLWDRPDSPVEFAKFLVKAYGRVEKPDSLPRRRRWLLRSRRQPQAVTAAPVAVTPIAMVNGVPVSMLLKLIRDLEGRLSAAEKTFLSPACGRAARTVLKTAADRLEAGDLPAGQTAHHFVKVVQFHFDDVVSVHRRGGPVEAFLKHMERLQQVVGSGSHDVVGDEADQMSRFLDSIAGTPSELDVS